MAVNRIALLSSATDTARAPLWGDTWFAGSFATALTRAGVTTQVHTYDVWNASDAALAPVVVNLRGLHRYQPRPGAVNVLWIISHGDEVTDDELDEFDLVLVASSSFTDQLRRRTQRRVEVFHQATDTTLFDPNRPVINPAHGIVVVANHRQPFRPGPRWLMELGIDFQLFGARWAGQPEARFLAGGYVANERLNDIYATADIVVADQWDAMSRDGFVANRIFDVAASGGFAISTPSPGITGLFGKAVPQYGSRDELGELVRNCLRHPRRRRRLARRAMRIVRAEHSFDVRARSLLALLGRDTADSGAAR